MCAGISRARETEGRAAATFFLVVAKEQQAAQQLAPFLRALFANSPTIFRSLSQCQTYHDDGTYEKNEFVIGSVCDCELTKVSSPLRPFLRLFYLFRRNHFDPTEESSFRTPTDDWILLVMPSTIRGELLTHSFTLDCYSIFPSIIVVMSALSQTRSKQPENIRQEQKKKRRRWTGLNIQLIRQEVVGWLARRDFLA